MNNNNDPAAIKTDDETIISRDEAFHRSLNTALFPRTIISENERSKYRAVFDVGYVYGLNENAALRETVEEYRKAPEPHLIKVVRDYIGHTKCTCDPTISCWPCLFKYNLAMDFPEEKV